MENISKISKIKFVYKNHYKCDLFQLLYLDYFTITLIKFLLLIFY